MMESLAGLIGSMGSSLLTGAESAGTAALASMLGGSGAGGGATSPEQIASDAGIKSSLQGANIPPSGAQMPSETTGSQSVSSQLGRLLGKTTGGLMSDAISTGSSQLSNRLVDNLLHNDPRSLAYEQGKDAQTYMNAAYPGTNKWDKLGQAGAASGVATTDTSALNARGISTQGNATSRANTKLTADTSTINAGIGAVTSRRNTHDQLAQSAPLVQAQVAKANADTAASLADTSLTPNRRRQIDAAAGAASASAQAATASAGASTAQAEQTRQLTGPKVQHETAAAESAKTPSVAGGIYQTGKTFLSEASDYADKKGTEFGNWLWEKTHDHVNSQLDIHKGSNGIKGATSSNSKRKH